MDSRPKDQTLKYLGPPTNSRGVVVKRRLHLGAATSLEELRDYKFFSPAIPYLWGGFREAYWCDWMMGLGHDVALFFHRFEQPIFEGFTSPVGDPGWNHGLMACRAEDFDKLVDFFCELTVTMRAAKAALRYGLQEVLVLDPLAMDRRKVFVGDQKLTLLNVFGLYGSHAVAYVEQPLQLARPRAAFREGDESMRTFAAAYFKERNPLNAVEELQLPAAGAEIPKPVDFAARSPEAQERILRAIRRSQET